MRPLSCLQPAGHGLSGSRSRWLYAERIGPLVREHCKLEVLLGAVDLSDSADLDRIRTAVFDLHEHIAKEEDGLFPASLTALAGDEWDASMEVWHVAHAGNRMIDEWRIRAGDALVLACRGDGTWRAAAAPTRPQCCDARALGAPASVGCDLRREG